MIILPPRKRQSFPIEPKYADLYDQYGFGPDYTKLARKVLGLNGDKYPVLLEIAATEHEPSGLMFRLLPRRRVNAKNTAEHRLQILCACGRWLPTGRMNQHAPTCKENPR